MAGIGHNSEVALALTQAAQEKLRQLVAMVERLVEEKKEVADRIKDVFSEAKSMGYDTKALREAMKVKSKMDNDRQKYEEEQAVTEVYLLALGLI